MLHPHCALVCCAVLCCAVGLVLQALGEDVDVLQYGSAVLHVTCVALLPGRDIVADGPAVSYVLLELD
jgi:hypothetical protein